MSEGVKYTPSGVYQAWELGLEPVPEPDSEMEKEAIAQLQDAVALFLTFGTPRDLIKIVALQL